MKAHLIIAAAALAFAPTIVATSAHGELIDIGKTLAYVTLDVPDPDNPGSTRNVDFGEIGGRLQVDPVQMQTSIGFRQTFTGQTGFDSFRFINIVTSDPFPPRWKDESGQYHQIEEGQIYVDPMSGGNMGPTQQAPNPAADRLPWYDGVRTSFPAADCGLNIFKEGEFDWTTNPTLNYVFGDAPTLTDGLRFVTVLVGTRGNDIIPIAGIPWGRTLDGMNYIDPVFLDSEFPAGLNRDSINKALVRSGYSGYSVVPEPNAAVLLALSLLGLACRCRLRRR